MRKLERKSSGYNPISRKVLSGLRKPVNRKVIDVSELRNARIHAENLEKSVITENELSKLDPLHGIYAYAQNKISVFIEEISALPALSKLTNAYTDAEDVYMPSGQVGRVNYGLPDYIGLGNTIEQKQSHLNAACSAWNISLLPEAKRKEAIDQFIAQYKGINPDVDDVENVRHDMALLIKEKLRLYPNEKKVIARAEFVEEAGKERIIVASITKT